MFFVKDMTYNSKRKDLFSVTWLKLGENIHETYLEKEKMKKNTCQLNMDADDTDEKTGEVAKSLEYQVRSISGRFWGHLFKGE